MDYNAHNAQGELRSYILGLILSLLFTIVPFAMVKYELLANSITFYGIFIFAVMQLFIQLWFFMHVKEEKRPRYNAGMIIFALGTVLVLVLGSFWIMYSLDHNIHVM